MTTQTTDARVQEVMSALAHADCTTLALDLTHDQHARAAALAYARSVEATDPELADDLRVRVVTILDEALS